MKNIILLFSVFIFMVSCDPATMAELERAMIESQAQQNQPHQQTNPYPAQNQGHFFHGTWSSEGDTRAPGNLTLQLTQTGGNISGTANYHDYRSGSSSGVLSVEGTTDGNTANITFYDQRGSAISSAILSKDQGNMHFYRNSGDTFLPREAILFHR